MRYRKFTQNTKVSGKRVIVRITANVSMTNGRIDKNGDSRLEKLIPLINHLTGKKAKVILLTHLGRPKGKHVNNLTVSPIAKRLSSMLQKKIIFIPQIVGRKVDKALDKMLDGDIILLENIRFYKKELLNQATFAKKLATYADLYINEAFADSHRKHASIVSLPLHLPAYAGFQFQDEITLLDKVLNSPKKPLGVIIGGAKIISKLGIISGLAKKSTCY